jgi:hypothetical protein
MNETPSRPKPALLAHSEKVLSALASEMGKDGVWEGHLTKKFAELDIPLAFYPHVISTLESVGAVAQEVRGGRSKPSRWRVLNPNVEALVNASTIRKASKAGRMSRLEGDIRDLRNTVGKQSQEIQELRVHVMAHCK